MISGFSGLRGFPENDTGRCLFWLQQVNPAIAVFASIHYKVRAVRKLLPPLIVFLIRTLALTVRITLEDRSGITKGKIAGPVVWVFWHNRILLVPVAYKRFCPGRHGVALTSPSKDGAILAGVMAGFGLGTVRGSSSRRGVTAMRELASLFKCGDDVAITPDGPRGPIYKLSPGVAKLAQVTGGAVLPINVSYSSYWELKSWDAFRIPKPFSRVKFVFGELHAVDPAADGPAFDAECEKLEAMLIAGKNEADGDPRAA